MVKYSVYQKSVETLLSWIKSSEIAIPESFSVPRNKEPMPIFKDLDLVEQLGSDIPRILETYGKECFKFSDNFLRMVFPKKLESDDLKGGAKDGAKDDLKEILTDRQQEILNFIIDDPKIAYRTVADKLKINPSAVQTHFETLKNKGVITRVGKTRGYWKVNNVYKVNK